MMKNILNEQTTNSIIPIKWKKPKKKKKNQKNQENI